MQGEASMMTGMNTALQPSSQTAMEMAYRCAVERLTQSHAQPRRQPRPAQPGIGQAAPIQTLSFKGSTSPGATNGLRLDDVLDEALLLQAWERVRANGGAAGVDGESVTTFGSRLLGHLQTLQTEVRSGRYVARALQCVQQPKTGGGTRPLAIPAVRDRVLLSALAIALGKRLEPTFDDASHGYRPGRSVMTALSQVMLHRDQGRLHVLEADIEAFFERVHHPGLLAALRPHVADPDLMQLMQHVLTPTVREGTSEHLATRGIAQGSPLSPLLANLVLHPLDIGLRCEGFALVRYADDFVVLGSNIDQVTAARERSAMLLNELHLKLHPRKSRITHFHHGFRFLGVCFQDRNLRALSPGVALLLPRLDPQRVEDPRADEPATVTIDDERLPLAPDELVSSTPTGPSRPPLLNTVHVGEAGAALRLDGERLLISAPTAPCVQGVPLGQVDQIAITANVMVSSALLRHCAQRRITVHLADPAGGAGGASLDAGALPDIELLLSQHQLSRDPALATAHAREILGGKLHNARVVLRRFARRSGPQQQAAVTQAVGDIARAAERLPFAADAAALRGHEGHAARVYFEGMATLLPPHWAFDRRRRRPPPDPVNVLLSYGYAVLHANMLTLVRLAGLNPHLGVLHTARPGGHALVNDLMEEFRAPAVDAVVLTLLREQRLGPAHFDTAADATVPCRLTREGRRLFVDALEAKLGSTFVHPQLSQALDMRRAMQFQVQHWRRVVEGRETTYRPMKFR